MKGKHRAHQHITKYQIGRTMAVIGFFGLLVVCFIWRRPAIRHNSNPITSFAIPMPVTHWPIAVGLLASITCLLIGILFMGFISKGAVSTATMIIFGAVFILAGVTVMIPDSRWGLIKTAAQVFGFLLSPDGPNLWETNITPMA
ncbi:hypothetical protein [Bifidobacterium aerophilum]|nr:hypothetical protein [Bifidobacterium aerophilum]